MLIVKNICLMMMTRDNFDKWFVYEHEMKNIHVEHMLFWWVSVSVFYIIPLGIISIYDTDPCQNFHLISRPNLLY